MIKSTLHEANITVVSPGVDRLTAMNAKTFKDEVTALINDGAAHLVVNFKDVTFVDSSGLGSLVGVLKKIGHRGDLAVSNLNADVEQMFRICRMDRVFTTYRDAETAVQTMADAS
jgi:anti-sigma B factor antagonist